MAPCAQSAFVNPSRVGSCARKTRIATPFMKPASTGCGTYFARLPKRSRPRSACTRPISRTQHDSPASSADIRCASSTCCCASACNETRAAAKMSTVAELMPPAGIALLPATATVNPPSATATHAAGIPNSGALAPSDTYASTPRVNHPASVTSAATAPAMKSRDDGRVSAMSLGLASRSARDSNGCVAGGTEGRLTNAQQVEAAILALEAQRGNLADGVLDVALAPLRAQLEALRADADRASAPMRLREVTVLFADIVGSTAMGARLDAEDTVAVVSTALARFGALVEAHRGRVARFTGDGLKGIFGADGDTEDAAESAVRCGLAILADARAYAVTLRTRQGIESFQVRIGINTGPVALGGGVEADKTAMGTAVNLAARLEQAAPPGGLLIGKDTFAHVRGVFDVLEQPPLSVKGHATPLATYLVQGARAREFRVGSRGVAGVAPRMVGRDAELARLQAAYDDAAATSALRAVTVFGEAGVGKSRLLTELQRAVHVRASGPTMLIARAHPQLRLQPYGLLREMLAVDLRIADTESAETARQRWREGLGPYIDALEAELLGHLVGLDFSAVPQVNRILSDKRQLRDRAFRASVAWLRKRATGTPSPLVLLLDDLHWVDEGSLDWVRHLLRNARDLPLFVVMVARPDLLERHPGWADGEAHHERLDMVPLDPDSRLTLARGLLQNVSDIPSALLDIVTQGGSGNPFFMEELVNMLIDDGVIERAADAAQPWHLVHERLGAVKVPHTIAGVLHARIDALAPTERSALQHASIIGPVFWDAALDALEPQASASLPALARRQMALPRDTSAFADCAEFTFSHHLLHQATYETVLKAVRRAGHARAAAWLSERLQDRSLEHLGATADHFERAGEREQAARYFARAAQAAADRYANSAALEHAQRALENIDAGDVEARFKVLQLREIVEDVLGERVAQASTLDEMATLYPPGTAPAREASIAFSRALLADRRGDFQQALSHARKCALLAERASVWNFAARGYGEWTFVLTRAGEFEQAREKVALALTHARRAADPLIEAQIVAVWANIEETSHQSQ